MSKPWTERLKPIAEFTGRRKLVLQVADAATGQILRRASLDDLQDAGLLCAEHVMAFAESDSGPEDYSCICCFSIDRESEKPEPSP
jgi:hypothetical protein